jgi:hypothetical protein
MGLDASVMCNCYRQGLASPPPVSPDLIEVDDEGYLSLAVPYDDNDELYFLFADWKQHACLHSDMEYASVRVANWTGYRAFQQALARIGQEHFPTLQAELPNSNGGLMSAISATKALQELELFRRANLGSNIFLVNSQTDDEIHEYIASYEGVFILSGRAGVDIGFDERGLFVVKRSEPRQELFRSMRFEQRLLEPDLTLAYKDGKVELIDLATGWSFEGTTAISGRQIPWPDGRKQDDQGRVRFEYPRFMHVEERKLAAGDFAYALDALTEIFQAAIITGNPVRWC